MATLATQLINLEGLEEVPVAAAGGGDQFLNNGDHFFHAINASGGDIIITFASPSQHKGLDIENPAVTVTAGEERFIGPFPSGVFNDASGYVQVTYDGVTSLTVAVLKLS